VKAGAALSTTARLGLPTRERFVYLYELARELVLRDLKMRYKRTFLGLAWSLIAPLAQWAVLGFVFRGVLQLEIERYLAFLFTGILVWSWLQGALVSCATSVVDSATLLRRPGFPAPILPVVAVASNGVHFVLSLPVLIAGATLDGQPFSPALIALPLLFLLQFVLTVGVGYHLATYHVVYRDTRHLLDVALTLGFYLTPVFYDPQLVPERFQPIYQLNPILHLLSAYRAVIVHGQFPDWRDIAVVAAFGAVFFALGLRRYRRLSSRFAEEL
jgi:lipopolysaccharide transport system permease protein